MIDEEGNKITGTMANVTQATPSIEVDSSGLITATATQEAGYVGAGTKTGTKQLTTQAAKTITPTTSNQTIAAGTYCSGAQTIKGDANLKAKNIAEGVSIFGVTGSHSGGFPNGTEWTKSNITSGNFKSVYNANGIWVVGDNSNGGLYYSTDGKTWTKSNITSGYFNSVTSVYNANGIWVAVGYNNIGLYYSTDGKTWTQSNITSGIFSSAYNANGIWVAVGGNGLYYSVSWKPN
jgi:hypothetical protein